MSQSELRGGPRRRGTTRGVTAGDEAGVYQAGQLRLACSLSERAPCIIHTREGVGGGEQFSIVTRLDKARQSNPWGTVDGSTVFRSQLIMSKGAQ